MTLSESQERMAIVIASSDLDTVQDLAHQYNIESTLVAKVTTDEDAPHLDRLQVSWQGKAIVDLARDFLDQNGAPRSIEAVIE